MNFPNLESEQESNIQSCSVVYTDRPLEQPAKWGQPQEPEHLIRKITRRIHQSLELQTILQTTVDDVRQFLITDRVVIFRFESADSGVVAVESVDEAWNALLGMTVRDPGFAGLIANADSQGRVLAITDVATAELSPCYVDLLTQFQVRANLVLPICQDQQLWGLLVAHHCQAAREWQEAEIELLQELAVQAAIAIKQSELYHQVQQLNNTLEHQVQERTHQLQQSLDFAAVVKRITDRVRNSLDEGHILQTAVQEMVSVLKVDYCAAAIYNPERTAATVKYEFTFADLPPALEQILQVADTPRVHQRLLGGEHFAAYSQGHSVGLHSAETGDMACPDLFDQYAAKLLYPIFLERPCDCSTEFCSTHQVDHLLPDTIGYLVVIDQNYHVFNQVEIKLVKQVANQCAIAIRQARLYQAAQAQVKALERLNQLKDNFLSTVSHELRTPVASMKMAIQMLKVSLTQTNPAPSDKTDRYLRILHDQCDREIALIDDLLALQRLEADIQPFQPTTIELKSWLTQVIQPFYERTQARQQHLQLQLPSTLPPLTSDPTCLERILMELLDNACKYSPIGATITIGERVDNDIICLTVTNSGISIPADELPQIFDKFHRVPSSDLWGQSGTGLGLALADRLTKHIGGSMHVSTDSEETCFTVRLPLIGLEQ
jgi:signal transduction histidine kinase